MPCQILAPVRASCPEEEPDVPELIQAKREVNGHLISLLTLMKSQRGLQQGQSGRQRTLFDAIDTLGHCLTALIGMVPNIQANKDIMLEATLKGFTTATDLADYLVRKSVPFRDAHELVGQAVQLAVSKGKGLEELSVEELNGPDQTVIESDIYDVLTLQGSIASRDHLGGTAPNQVRQAIARARATI